MRGMLLLLVLAVLLPLLVVQAGIYTAWYYSRWSEQETATLETAREAAATFEAYIRDVRRQESAIGAALTGPHHYTAEEANLFLTAAGRDYPSIRSWSWTNPEGTVIASSRSKAIGLKLGDRAYFQELRSGRSWVVSDLLVDRLTGARMFVIASRIDDRKGSLAGAIIATAEVTDLGSAPLPCIIRSARPSPFSIARGSWCTTARNTRTVSRLANLRPAAGRRTPERHATGGSH